MSLKKLKIPSYTLAQDLSNSITHGLGAVFGVVALILMLLKVCVWGYTGANQTEYIYRIIGVVIYGLGLIICYSISCIYHGLAKNNGKKVLRVLDHDTVYLLISGTYTIYCLVSLRNVSLWGVVPNIGWIIFAICWIGVTIGIVFNSIDMNKFSALSFILYIVIGWVIIIASKELIDILTIKGFLLMLSGGVAYSVGAILYGIGKKYSFWFHTVFHVFILIGSVLQFLSIWFFVLN